MEEGRELHVKFFTEDRGEEDPTIISTYYHVLEHVTRIQE